MCEGQENPGSVQGLISPRSSMDVFISMSSWDRESYVDRLCSQRKCEWDLEDTFPLPIGHSQY
jgi:hypothetical protein